MSDIKTNSTLEEIRAAKADAEQEIVKALARLTARTGFAAINCEIRTISAQAIHDKYSRQIVSAVTLSLESI